MCKEKRKLHIRELDCMGMLCSMLGAGDMKIEVMPRFRPLLNQGSPLFGHLLFARELMCVVHYHNQIVAVHHGITDSANVRLSVAPIQSIALPSAISPGSVIGRAILSIVHHWVLRAHNEPGHTRDPGQKRPCQRSLAGALHTKDRDILVMYIPFITARPAMILANM